MTSSLIEHERVKQAVVGFISCLALSRCDHLLIPVSDAASAPGWCVLQPGQFRCQHGLSLFICGSFGFATAVSDQHNFLTSRISFVVTSGFAVTSDFTSGRLHDCFLIPMSDAADAHGSASFILDSSGVSMVFLAHPPLFCLGSPRDQYICLAFPFPLRVTFGLVIHAQTEIFELFMVSGFISYLVLMTMSQFSFLCLTTDALCAFQPGQFRFLHGILFDVACWTAGREQLMHMSHFSDSLSACLVLMCFEFVRA